MQAKPLSRKDQWVLRYIKAHIIHWDDVKDSAARAMDKIENHSDFIAWAEYFLPDIRKKEITLAWRRFVISQQRTQSKKTTVQLELDEQTAERLKAKAKQARCSVADYIQRIAS